MEILKNCAIGFLITAAAVIFFISLFSKKMIKTLLLNALSGIAVLAIINITSRFTGVFMPINQWTVSAGAVFGMPAVAGILVLNIFL